MPTCASSVLGEDYSVADPLTATFTSGTVVGDTVCAAITIIDDAALEFDHSFTVQLAGTDPPGVPFPFPVLQQLLTFMMMKVYTRKYIKPW